MANEYRLNLDSPSTHEVTETLDQVNDRLKTIYEQQLSTTSTNCSLNFTSSQRSTVVKNRIFQVRRTFLLIILFDMIFMILLWIIYNEILSMDITKAFQSEVIGYKISCSTFDIVVVSGLRFLFLFIPYAILKWSHWFFIAFTTLGSTGFIIAKTIVYTMDKSGDKSSDYLLLIISFILAWIEIWFFDYRVLPHERRLRHAFNQNEQRPLLSTVESGTISPVLNQTAEHMPTIPRERLESFYSPIHSVDGSDMEDQNNEEHRPNRSDSNISQSILGTPISTLDHDLLTKNEEYEKQADELLDEIWKIYRDEQIWYEEARSKDGIDIILSKTYPKWGKVFRLNSIVEGSRLDINEMLFERQEDIPKWSSSVDDCQILEVINNNLYITYQLTNEQAQGLIAKRDFVNITARRYIDNVIILAAQACVHSRMPQRDNCVRAENGLTAYVIEKVDETTCKFTWILNVNLKGWLPQYLINSCLSNVQFDFIESLRNYLSKAQSITSSD